MVKWSTLSLPPCPVSDHHITKCAEDEIFQVGDSVQSMRMSQFEGLFPSHPCVVQAGSIGHVSSVSPTLRVQWSSLPPHEPCAVEPQDIRKCAGDGVLRVGDHIEAAEQVMCAFGRVPVGTPGQVMQ